MSRSSLITKMEIENNDPPIEVNQIWRTPESLKQTVPLRRVRILAEYVPHEEIGPNYAGRHWIIQEMPGGVMRLAIGELRVIPEFNLRYVFELENNRR